MLDLRRIGLFTRDNEQDYRLGSLRKLFSRAGIELVDDAGAMDAGALDLVIALGGDGTVLRALAAWSDHPLAAGSRRWQSTIARALSPREKKV